MFIHEAYIDLDGKTYLIGDLKITDEDFSQYPVIELLNPKEPKQRKFGKTRLKQVYKIIIASYKPAPGVFEDPSKVTRTVIQIIENGKIENLLVRTQRIKSKGDMLEII